MKIKWFSLVRIIGLALVLVYHFFKDFLPGGFVGVDVFFTFSGYLITALVIEEFRRSGQFRLRAYLKRRFVRIFPPLLLSLVFTLPFALLVSPDFTGGIAKQAAGALGFATNYFEILSGGSYEAQLLPHLYIHTWSLALEMHYYLLWGLACAAAAFLIWALVKHSEKRVRLLKGVLAGLAIALAALCYWQMRALFAASPENPSAAYFASTSHAFPFFIGSAAAVLFGMHISERAARRLRGRAALVCSILVFTLGTAGLFLLGRGLAFAGAFTYRYGFLLASLLTVALIFAARALHEATPNLREPKPVSVLANLSYSVYLFHWPLYIVFGERMDNLWASLLTFALSCVFAALVYYGIEPLLHGKRPWRGHKALKAFYPAVAVLAAAALAGTVLVYLRAPAISAMEQTIIDGNIYQDEDGVEYLASNVRAIQAEPLQKRGELLEWRDVIYNPGLAAGNWEPSVAPDSIRSGVSFCGDSVALGANRLLDKTIHNIRLDSKVSRSLAQGRQLLKDWAEREELQDLVVVSLGANGYGAWQAQIDGMVAELPAGHRLIFITPFLGKPQKGIFDKEIAAYYRELAQTHDWITVADWAGAIKDHTDLLAADKIHFGKVQQCSQMFVDCLLDAMVTAERGPAKG